MPDREHILFVTGKLAAPSLEQVVPSLANTVGFEASIQIAKISVASLMTTDWLVSKLAPPAGTSRVIFPGLCRGDIEKLREAFPSIQFERGPNDLLDLPDHFQESSRKDSPYGAHDIEILSEINHANRLTSDALLREAKRLIQCGADVIDLGCTPGEPWKEIEGAVRMLRADGIRVSVDSFDPDEVAAATRAGAELVLSVNSSNIDHACDWGVEVVLIPDDHQADAWLDQVICQSEFLKTQGVRHRIDPILDPIGFGFAKSMGRCLDLRRALPHAEMMLGIGNLTELTEVDSAGVNAVLIGFCQEVGIRSILTTEVINWARSSTAEIDVARRLMHHAVTLRRLPKHRDSRLVMLRDPKIHVRGEEELRRLQKEIRDPNYRLFAERGLIHALNSDQFESDSDPFDLFDRLGVEDPSHAFYLGWEMMKASLALQLGKDYTQDRALRWGFLTREEISHRDKSSSKRDRQE
ncbi:dihydropteroate synthase [bacterium]|nr:dihydropteroate synthase [bacterium]